ncbi:hypothetical protein CRV11_02500 [Candidatus Pantoea edessiphila]|uniref:Uncharacterized protein n=1 Tax=Candidatus Pantoea edessiphila TaxID=2044610 RepID=A0A2P5SXW5_9GAMM|nr:hypothetical protein CRV11_02500 [Candidatus Pantoea edessiphila]
MPKKNMGNNISPIILDYADVSYFLIKSKTILNKLQIIKCLGFYIFLFLSYNINILLITIFRKHSD